MTFRNSSNPDRLILSPAESMAMPNRYLARRNFIKGLAAMGALPAFKVEQLFAQTQAPLRVLFVALQHGWGGGRDTVEGGGIRGSEFDFVLPEYWQPFNAIKEDCVFVDGLRGTFWGNAHDVSYTDTLTAAVPLESPISGVLGAHFPEPVGPSIDFLIEQFYNRGEALRFSANYRSWGAAYHPLSFNDRLQRLVFRTTARDAYDNIFASLQTDAPVPPPVSPALRRVFPHLSQETQQIITEVTPSEQEKLRNYLDALRLLENRVVGQTVPGTGTARLKAIPNARATVAEEIDSYLDMIRVAFTNDSHRVAVLGIGEEREQFTWRNTNGQTILGQAQFRDFHEEIAHFRGKGPDNSRAYIGWTFYNAQKIVNFVRELQNTIDTDGNRLIDNTIIVLTGEVGNGYHNISEKNHIVIGGGSRLRRGRWFQVPLAPANSMGSRDINGTYRSIVATTSWLGGQHASRSHADLFVKIAQLAGMNTSTVGIDAMNRGALEI